MKLVAIVDGPDPDAGTSWEVGYAYGIKKPIVLLCTDFRSMAGNAGGYNPMLTQGATIPSTAIRVDHGGRECGA